MKLLLENNSKWIKGIVLFCLVLFFYFLTNSSVEAAPSYSDTPTFCPSGYTDFAHGTTGGVNRRVCCPSGTEPAHNEFYCQTKTSGANVDGVDARSNATLAGQPEICKQGQFLVNKVGIADLDENYCLSVGEKVQGGTQDGKYFAACKSSLSPFKLDIYKADGTTEVGGFTLPLFCEGGGGLFVSSVNNCLCENGTEVELKVDDACTELCIKHGGGVLYDPKAAGSLPGICQGSECCNGDDTCLACVGEDNSTGNVYTALGCISTSQEGIVVWLIRIALILTTSIGVFRFVQASFLIRSGDPEKIKEGQEIVTSAIVALVLVLVSVPLLQFIGVNLLGIFPSN